MCTDDNARALILLLHAPDPSAELRRMMKVYMRFVEDAALPGGGFRNRRNASGHWTDRIGSDDSQGRAIWALGNVVSQARDPALQRAAIDLFDRQRFQSPSPRANAFALLGAVEVLSAIPEHPHASRLIRNWAGHIVVRSDTGWPWPETRLAYDNARFAEALIAAGTALDNGSMTSDGLRLLEWLVDVETSDGHFSFAPVGGWAPGEPRPGFDQQPVEAAAFADASARAWMASGDERWRGVVAMAARWFLGDNDLGVPIYDDATGASYDGLTPGGPNLNRGAESTISGLSTMQTAALLEL
ncbi:MAG: glycosyltransferase [Acidimicrobiia bacterium]